MKEKDIGKLVVIASSTGGPKALYSLIPMIHERLDAPVVIVQHMPKGFTASLAQRLNEISKISVSESVNGEILKKGHVYIAKGGKHLKFAWKGNGQIQVIENEDDPINGLRPCANVTLESLCDIPIDNFLCVVLTGMGADGCKGIQKLKEHKDIYTIAQNKDTCVVYGMPKAIVDNGLADIVLPLNQISQEINKKTGVF